MVTIMNEDKPDTAHTGEIIGYLGPPGTFSQSAVWKYWDEGINTVSFAIIDDIFKALIAGKITRGVVPIENSTEGGVTVSEDAFVDFDVTVTAEIVLPIEIGLLSRTQDLTVLKTVYAHQQALAQCRSWLSHNLPHCELKAVSSNAEAARLAADDPTAAALGHTRAADLYRLNIVRDKIQDRAQNRTRFLVIGGTPPTPSGNDKTSLLLTLDHTPGALLRVFTPLSDNGINMTKIESRPMKGKLWEYRFFLDVAGHRDDANLQRALVDIEANCAYLKILGSYPAAPDIG